MGYRIRRAGKEQVKPSMLAATFIVLMALVLILRTRIDAEILPPVIPRDSWYQEADESLSRDMGESAMEVIRCPDAVDVIAIASQQTTNVWRSFEAYNFASDATRLPADQALWLSSVFSNSQSYYRYHVRDCTILVSHLCQHRLPFRFYKGERSIEAACCADCYSITFMQNKQMIFADRLRDVNGIGQFLKNAPVKASADIPDAAPRFRK